MHIMHPPLPMLASPGWVTSTIAWLAHPGLPVALPLALALGGLGLDRRGVGDQWDRDRWAAGLALPGLGGLLAGAGWCDVAAGHGRWWTAAAAGTVVVAASTLTVTLIGGKRDAGALNWELWGAVLLLDLTLPATHGTVAAVLAWPWDRGTPTVAGLLLACWVAALAWAAGWRPNLAVSRSPAWVDRSWSHRGYVSESETDSETEIGRETSTGHGRALRDPAAWDAAGRPDSPAVVTGGGHAVTGPPTVRVTGHVWGPWWRRWWLHAAPELVTTDLPPSHAPVAPVDVWLARQLRRQAADPRSIATKDIVDVACRSYRLSRATAFRRIAAIRADLGIGA